MSSPQPNHIQLSPLAEKLLRAMAEAPERVEYNTRVLGGAFRDSDIERLDNAYAELNEQGFTESAGAVISFFGQPKRLYKITEAGQQRARELAA